MFSIRETAPWHMVEHEALLLPKTVSTPFTVFAWICGGSNQAGPLLQGHGAGMQPHAGSFLSPLQPGVSFDAIK